MVIMIMIITMVIMIMIITMVYNPTENTTFKYIQLEMNVQIWYNNCDIIVIFLLCSSI